jgi:membrane protein DedA with SNARE-associated domain
MLSVIDGLWAGFQAALSGMATAPVIAIVLALTTLLLEDLAIAAGAALATQGLISWDLAFVAVAGGIAVGDWGLYGLGAAARRVPWLQRRYIGGTRSAAWSHSLTTQLHTRLFSAVMLARVVPGLRLVTYTACGFLRVPWLPFSLWVSVAVSLWTAGLIAALWHIPAPLAVALPIVLLAAAVPVWRWSRQRFTSTLHSSR